MPISVCANGHGWRCRPHLAQALEASIVHLAQWTAESSGAPAPFSPAKSCAREGRGAPISRPSGTSRNRRCPILSPPACRLVHLCAGLGGQLAQRCRPRTTPPGCAIFVRTSGCEPLPPTPPAAFASVPCAISSKGRPHADRDRARHRPRSSKHRCHGIWRFPGMGCSSHAFSDIPYPQEWLALLKHSGRNPSHASGRPQLE